MLLFNFDLINPPCELGEVLDFAAAKERVKAGAAEDFSALAVCVATPAQALMANAARASFIVPAPQIALQTAKLAEFYLFDSKILAFIAREEDLELAAAVQADAAALMPNHLYCLRQNLSLD